MKKTYFILLIIISLINCTSENYKGKLIGEWYYQELPTMGLIFSQDSLFLNSSSSTRQKWNIDKTTIYLPNTTDLEIDSLNKLGLRFSFNYSLSENKDTLRWRAEKDTTNTIYKFIRIKNQFEHFQKTLDFKFDLPKSKAKLISIGDDSMNPHYYIGLVNDKLMIKNDTQFIELDDVFREIFKFELLLKNEEFEKLKMVLFTDKNIPEFKIDSIKNILRKTSIKRIFRVYKNDTIDYKKNLNWYGIYE